MIDVWCYFKENGKVYYFLPNNLNLKKFDCIS